MNRIRDLRLSHNWTQQDLAERMNTAKSVISRYEGEKLGLDVPIINRLCDLFHVTSDYLLCRSDTPLPVLSDEDARILAAYHAANLRDRCLVDQILAAYLSTEQEGTAVS